MGRRGTVINPTGCDLGRWGGPAFSKAHISGNPAPQRGLRGALESSSQALSNALLHEFVRRELREKGASKDLAGGPLERPRSPSLLPRPPPHLAPI